MAQSIAVALTSVIPMAQAALFGFSNTDPITIPASSTLGAASPYSSDIVISGLVGNIDSLTVTLTDYTHTWSSDTRIALESPTGARILLMQFAGPNSANLQTSVNITFDDNALSSLPGGTTNTTLITTDTYRPTDVNGSTNYAQEAGFTGTLLNPGPSNPSSPGPWPTSLISAFGGQSPNGTWKLWVEDSYPGEDGGRISGGWSIAGTTAVPEPQEYAMVAGLGLVGLAVFRRIRAKASATT